MNTSQVPFVSNGGVTPANDARQRAAYLLASGPGRLTQALGISGAHDGADLSRAPVGDLAARLDALVLAPREARIARDLLTEIRRRVSFLEEVGLGYLGLDRAAACTASTDGAYSVRHPASSARRQRSASSQ